MEQDANSAPALANPSADMHADMKPADLNCPSKQTNSIEDRAIHKSRFSRRKQAATKSAADATRQTLGKMPYYEKWCASLLLASKQLDRSLH